MVKVTIFLLMVLVPVGAFAQWLVRDDAIMGTPVHVELWAQDKARGEQVINRVFEIMRRVDRLMSSYKPGSELSQLNLHGSKRWVAVGDELYNVIRHGVEMSQVTGGAFDITYASVGYLYNFRQRIKPADSAIKKLLPAINYHYVSFNQAKRAVRFTGPNVRIDLGGIAKGYAVDSAMNMVADKGFKHAYISAGGDSRILGDKRGRPWLVGVQHPRDRKQIIATLPLKNSAVSTSGDYERFFIDQDGSRQHHIIDPKTGHSANKVHSVTVVGKECFTTDALSTGMFVMGVEKALALAEKLDGIEVVIVDNQGRLHFSRGLVNPM